MEYLEVLVNINSREYRVNLSREQDNRFLFNNLNEGKSVVFLGAFNSATINDEEIRNHKIIQAFISYAAGFGCTRGTFQSKQTLQFKRNRTSQNYMSRDTQGMELAGIDDNIKIKFSFLFGTDEEPAGTTWIFNVDSERHRGDQVDWSKMKLTQHKARSGSIVAFPGWVVQDIPTPQTNTDRKLVVAIYKKESGMTGNDEN